MGADAHESVQAQVRRQQRLDALCAATLRALSARPDVQRRASHWFAGTQQLPSFAPHLHPQAQLLNPLQTSAPTSAPGISKRLRLARLKLGSSPGKRRCNVTSRRFALRVIPPAFCRASTTVGRPLMAMLGPPTVWLLSLVVSE